MRDLILYITTLFFVLPTQAKQISPSLQGGAGESLPLDYSYVGYKLSTTAIPDAPVKCFVSCQSGDQYSRLQKAIDYVSSLKPDKKTGLRGAILLDKGTFEISKPLRISASGVILRGTSKTETIISKTGTDRGAIVYIEGKNDRKIIDTLQILDDYTKVGSMAINVPLADKLKVGDNLLVVRTSTKEWIASIGCDVFGGNLPYWGWKPGEMDVQWDRTVTAASDTQMTLDAPLTIALDKKQGPVYVLWYEWEGRIHDSGVENLTLTTPAKANLNISSPRGGREGAENHAWDGIYIDNATDCWARKLDFSHLAGSAVNIQRGAQQITVEDCISKEPVSEIGGLRRRTFLTMGGKCLFQRCYSEEGINDFSAGYCAPGPNAFVQCDAVGCHGFSGSSSSWATGLLFDNVNIEGGGISFKNLGLDKWGAGWNTANSALYQCSASYIDCYKVADDANNYAIGCWAYCQGDGFWFSTNDHVNPYSAFQTQLEARIGKEAAATQCRMLERDHDGSTSPTVERAAQMAQEALKPRITMEQWIDMGEKTLPNPPCREGVDTSIPKGVKDIDAIKINTSAINQSSQLIPVISDGKIILVNKGTNHISPSLQGGQGESLVGTFHRTPWWNGRTRYPYMAKADYAVTRFVPGMECRGGTDRIDSVLANINKQHVAVWNQNYGLWYDRRRDDHERIKRQNGDVWAPFFEQAIARSGQGTAWDGLSKYDLTKLNSWYFDRINQLADAAPDMLIINQNYFQHNIIEAGAHWVDCPWRSANNIQSEQTVPSLQGGLGRAYGTHFLEPVPFTGDKRIFTADLFYDTTDKDRAALYKQYIWNVLDAQADRPNIYQSVSEEFTGPQHFVEFWLDCIAEWQAARGKDARVILNATKDVTDAIMAKPKYSNLVDIIEIEQWFYDSSLTASTNKTYSSPLPSSPRGGEKLNASADNNSGQDISKNSSPRGGREGALVALESLYAPKGGLNLAPRQHMRLTKTGHPTFADVYRCVSETRQAYPTKPVLYYAKEYDRNPWAVLLAGGSCPVLTITDKTLAHALATMQPVYSADDASNGIYRMAGTEGTIIYNNSSSPTPLPAGKAYVINQKDGSVKPLTTKDITPNALVWIK